VLWKKFSLLSLDILWDEAWFAFAGLLPKQRTAMFTVKSYMKKINNANYRKRYNDHIKD
jgi:hypothetical protein